MRKHVHFTQQQVQDMARRYESGASFREIAEGVPCAKNTVRRVLVASGVKPNVGRSLSVKMRGKATRLGAKWSDESRARASAAQRGRPGTRFGPPSPETLAKISAGTKGKNVKHTPEQRAEIERLRQACKRFLARSLSAAGRKKLLPSAKALGYTPHDLAAHLGSRPEGAHVDHYVPIAEFVKRGIHDARVINALPNLRWMDGSANQRKSDKVPHDADAVIERCVSAAHFTDSGVTYTPGLA
jgi:hypothetical protein